MTPSQRYESEERIEDIEESENNLSARSKKVASLKRTVLSDCESSSGDEDISSDDDDDAEMSDKKRPIRKVNAPLRAGDVIEYYHPMGVSGKPEWLKAAVILGVDATDKRCPLNLDNRDVLNRSALIKRVKRRRFLGGGGGGAEQQQWEACAERAVIKEICQHGLLTSGTMETLAMKATADKSEKTAKKKLRRFGRRTIIAVKARMQQRRNQQRSYDKRKKREMLEDSKLLSLCRLLLLYCTK